MMRVVTPAKMLGCVATAIVCAHLQSEHAHAEILTQQFMATVTVQSTEPTCSVSAPAIDFGNIVQGEAIDGNNNYSTEFELKFDCSAAIAGVNVIFARESGDASGFWRMQGKPGNSIDYRMRKADGTPLTPRIGLPSDLSAGTSSERYIAWIDSIDNAGVTGSYTSTVTVTIEF